MAWVGRSLRDRCRSGNPVPDLASFGETRLLNEYTNPLSKGHAMKRVLLLSTATMLAVSGFARPASAQTTPKPAAGSDAQPVAVMLEQGIYQEETAGNLEAAAKTYRQIVDQAAFGRSLVAQALSRLAAIQVRQKQLDAAQQNDRAAENRVSRAKRFDRKSGGRYFRPQAWPHRRRSLLGLDRQSNFNKSDNIALTG